MGLSAFSHWASPIWALRRGGGLWVRWVCGFFAVMVFVGLRWINGVCWVCGGLTGFAGFAVMVFVGFAGFFLWWFAVD